MAVLANAAETFWLVKNNSSANTYFHFLDSFDSQTRTNSNSRQIGYTEGIAFAISRGYVYCKLGSGSSMYSQGQGYEDLSHRVCRVTCR